MAFKPLDPDVAEALLEEHTDTLTERVRKELAFYNDQMCLRCGGKCRAEANVRKMVKTGRSDQYLCRCMDCGCLFDPTLQIIVEMGNLGRLRPSIPLIHGD